MRRLQAAVMGAIVVTLMIIVAAVVRDIPTDLVRQEHTPAPSTMPSAPTADPTGSSQPERGLVMLGATGQYRWEIEEHERELGRKLTGARVFRRWDQRLLAGDQMWARNTGHTIFLSIKSKRADGSVVKWRDIADAKPGSRLHDEMLRQARQIQNFGATLYVIFNHEADARTSRPMGKPEDFVAAWRKLVDTYRAASVTNARYVWVLTDWAFRGKAKVANAYYPGDEYVDHIGVDGYNWLGCTTADESDGVWRSPAEILDGHRRFGTKHPDKGLMVLEWGSVEDPNQPGRKAGWIQQANELFRKPRWKQYRAIMHYDARGLETPHSPCDFDYRTSPSALEAWRKMLNDPVYDAEWACDIESLTRELSHLFPRP